MISSREPAVDKYPEELHILEKHTNSSPTGTVLKDSNNWPNSLGTTQIC